MRHLAIIVLAAFGCSQILGQSTSPTSLDIHQLSELLLVPPNRLVYELGSPELVFLDGADSEGPPTPHDGLEFRYSIVLWAKRPYPATVWVHLDANSFLVKAINLEFSGPRPELAELETAADAPKRIVEHVMIWDEGELEGWLSECHHPGGPIQSWVFQDLGLQVLLEEGAGSEKPVVDLLSFSAQIKSGGLSFPPCDD